MNNGVHTSIHKCEDELRRHMILYNVYEGQILFIEKLDESV